MFSDFQKLLSAPFTVNYSRTFSSRANSACNLSWSSSSAFDVVSLAILACCSRIVLFDSSADRYNKSKVNSL